MSDDLARALRSHPKDITKRTQAVAEALWALPEDQRLSRMMALGVVMADFEHIMMAMAEAHPELRGELKNRMLDVDFDRMVSRGELS